MSQLSLLMASEKKKVKKNLLTKKARLVNYESSVESD